MTTPGTQGEVSPESMGKTASSAVGSPPRRKTGLSPHYWEHCGTKSAKTLQRKAIRTMEKVEVESQKGNSRLDVYAPAISNVY